LVGLQTWTIRIVPARLGFGFRLLRVVRWLDEGRAWVAQRREPQLNQAKNRVLKVGVAIV
jgi:hypothetical protein